MSTLSWIEPGTAVAEPPDLDRDSEIVAHFLSAVEGYGPREIARMVEGINPSDVTRWRASGAKRLSRDKREVLLSFLRSRGGIDEVERVVSEWIPEMLRKIAQKGEDKSVLRAIKLAVAEDESIPLHARNALDIWLNHQLDDQAPEH